MDTVFRSLCVFLLAVLGLTTLTESAWSVEDQEEILVGRIAHIEGDLLRYLPEEKDWVLTVVDAPFGLEDVLYAGDGARAELILPNATWLRIGEQTQVQLIDLVADATVVDVASGQARLYSNSGTTLLKATTPFGSVVAPAGSAFDLYVGDESLEVIAVRGEVDFIHESNGQRYPIRVGGDSVIADNRGVTGGNGTVDSDWDDWNTQRESLWDRRQQGMRSSSDLVPNPIRHEAYVLEENGRWERVYYDGAYRDMWRPTRVVSGWQPFTVGRWVDYYGDNCWIPDEPFGYLTHHYGSWIFVDAFRTWYWLPPLVRRTTLSPVPRLGFGWYPGRVGWFSRGKEIGWVVLAPNEDYYGNRHWGHRTKVIGHRVPMINPARYRYIDHALVVERDHLYRRHRGPHDLRRDFRNSQILHQFKPVTAWHEFKGDKRRHYFSDRQAGRKPHVQTLKRINDNRQLLRAGGRLDRQRLEQDLRRHPRSREIPRSEERQRPKLSHKMVDADKMARPLDRTALPRKEIKPRERERLPFRDNRSSFGSRDGRQPERQPALDQRRQPLQPRTVPGKVLQGGGVAPDRFGAGRDQVERRGQVERQRRDDRPPATREKVEQRKTQAPSQSLQKSERDSRLGRPVPDSRRQQVEKTRQQTGQEKGRELENRRNGLNIRQEDDRRRQEIERRRQEQQQYRRQLEQQKRREDGIRQKREEQQRQERRETIRRQQENDTRERMRIQQRQLEQQQQQELLRRQKDEQQRRSKGEQRRQLEEQQRREKVEQRRQQELKQQRQQPEIQKGRQRQERLRQEQPRQRPGRDVREPREHNQEPRKKRQPLPVEDEQARQPI